MSELLLQETCGISDNEFLVMKSASDLLTRAYPAYLWGAAVRGGMLDIFLPVAHPSFVYGIKYLESFSSSDLDKKIRTAGGAILEHLKMSRTRMSQDEVNSKATDLSGRLIIPAW